MKRGDRTMWGVAVLLLAAAAVSAAEKPDAAEAPGVALTIYAGTAVVKDVRTLRLEEGRGTVEFQDVSAQIRPTTVHFTSLTDPDGTKVLEQNFQYDLVGTFSLLERYIDREITVLTRDGRSLKGTLLSHEEDDEGQARLTIKEKTGITVISGDENIHEIRYPALPEGLRTRPTLVWKVGARKGGDHLVRVAYRTGGLSWSADYSAIVDAEDTRLDVQGWVSLENDCGTTFRDARIKLMAGDVRQVKGGPRFEVGDVTSAAAAAAGGGDFGDLFGGAVSEKAFFEYHLYTLPQPTTVANREIKQIELLKTSGVPVTKRYVFESQGRYWHVSDRYGDDKVHNANVFLEFMNDEKSHLGMALPAGVFRVFKRDPADGDLEFVGEDEIRHTPKDERVRLYVGDAFDVVGERTDVDARPGTGWRVTSIQVELRNHKDQNVVVLVREHHDGSCWDIPRTSHPFKKAETGVVEFEVPVPAGGKTRLNYAHLSWNYDFQRPDAKEVEVMMDEMYPWAPPPPEE